MNEVPSRITEFLTVLVFALAIVAVSMLSILNLSAVPRAVALIVMVVTTIASWSYLRKRFHRN